jgi:CRISPR-associated protein Cas5t
MTQLQLSLETNTQYLRLKAPFAAFRPFQSGSYRSTTPVPSFSAVYGLLLNLAGIEQRQEMEGKVTLIKPKAELPKLAIAIGQVKPSSISLINQQLHNYPVGQPNKKQKDIKFILYEKSFGSKYWIAPVRREVLVDLDLIIGLQAPAEFWLKINQGLDGEAVINRYGLPFAGDNNFLFDEIYATEKPDLARWYCPLEHDTRPNPGACRLTLWIDRGDNTKTKIKVFSPSDFRLEPPKKAWQQLPK